MDLNLILMELAMNELAELFPHIGLRSLTFFLPTQLNLEGHWEAAIFNISY